MGICVRLPLPEIGREAVGKQRASGAAVTGSVGNAFLPYGLDARARSDPL
jgi:hypothetical protein